MAVQATDTNYLTSLYAITLEQYIPKLVDNIFDGNAVLEQIKSKSKVAAYDGGKSVVVPIQIGKNTQGTSFSGYDEITPTAQKGFINAELAWSYYAIPAIISHQEMEENQGKAKIADIVEARVMQAENSLLDVLSTALWATSPATKDMRSFPVMIEAAPGAYMGVTDTAWQNKYRTGAMTSAANLMGKIYRDLTDGSVKPDLIVTSDSGEEKYEDFITGKNIDIGLRYTSNDKADIAYGRFSYKGIPIVVDKHVPDADDNELTPNFWFLNTSALGFKMKGIEQTEWLPSHTMPGAKSKFMITTCQLFTSERRRQGLLAITA